MCRLYGLQATHPTRAACELLDAQNALIQQSRKDGRGLSNPHGWGMGSVQNGATHCFRQVEPASESAAYRDRALEAGGTTLMAHVRRATVGAPKQVNTHPFLHGHDHGQALLMHNGHIPAFEEVRARLLSRLSPERQRAIQGTTDSEHVLALLLQHRSEAPDAPLHQATRRAIREVQQWVRAAAPGATVDPSPAQMSDLDHDELETILGLNLLWTDGTTLAGSRLNRTLWRVTRAQPLQCPVCGMPHAHPPEQSAYRATALASERITDESWTAVPNGSVFTAAPDGSLHVEALQVEAPGAG